MPKYILLVDDEVDIRELISSCLLHNFEVEVTEACSGDEAIEYIKTNAQVDLVVSDYKMPGGDGIKLFKYLQNQNKEIPFILCSGHVVGEDVGISGKNFVGNVIKPDIFKSLIELVEKSLFKKTPEPLKIGDHKFSKMPLSIFKKLHLIDSVDYFTFNEEKSEVRQIETLNSCSVEIANKLDQEGHEYVYIPTHFCSRVLKVAMTVLSQVDSSLDKDIQFFKDQVI